MSTDLTEGVPVVVNAFAGPDNPMSAKRTRFQFTFRGGTYETMSWEETNDLRKALNRYFRGRYPK